MSCKPRIVTPSADTDDTFIWQSDGWNTMKKAHTAKARRLMDRARKAIKEGEDVLDVIRRLEEAGFEVERTYRDDSELPQAAHKMWN